MDAKLSFFSELCACVGTLTQPQREAVWSALSHYNIEGTSAATSFPDSLRQFLMAKQVDGLAPKTLAEYRRTLSAFGAALSDVPPARASADHVRAYLTSLTEKGLKPSTIQTYANALRSFFSWLYTEGQIERNPMVKIKARNPESVWRCCEGWRRGHRNHYAAAGVCLAAGGGDASGDDDQIPQKTRRHGEYQHQHWADGREHHGQ